MEVSRVEGVEAYGDLVAPLLDRAPARHNLMLGLLDVLRRRPESYQGFALWAVPDDRLAYAASRAFRFLASPCYFVFLHWARGQTLGKMVFRVRVVTLAGGPLPFGISVLRHLGSWISAAILGVGYLVAAFRSDKRALHDLIAGTRVEHVT